MFKALVCFQGFNRCWKNEDFSITFKEVEHVGKMECVSRFCYLGDMIGSGGGAEEASRA
jgi:hypothetical protein